MTTTEVPHPLADEAPIAAGPRPAGQVAAVLRSELIKVTTVRAHEILLATVAIVGLLTSWATATFVTDEGLTVTDVFLYPMLLTAVLSAIGGVLLFTSEVQHGTVAGSLTAHPSRWPVAVAKVVLATGFGLLLGAVGLIAGWLGALAGGLDVGSTAGLPTTVLWALLYTWGSALLGLGVGMVVRHSAGAVSGVLVWWLVVEGSIATFTPADAVRVVPFDAGFHTLGVYSDFDSPETAASALPNPLHATIFWGYVIAAVALGTVLLVRRDAD